MAEQESLVRLRPKNEGEKLKVTETVLRKRDRDLKGAANRAWVRAEAKKNVKRIRRIHLITTAEKMVKRERQSNVDRKRFLSISKQLHPRVNPKHAVVVAVRNTLRNACSETMDLLRELGLWTYYAARFFPNNSEYLQKLRLVEPFVFFGYPTLDTIRTLFLRRGCIPNNLDVKNPEPSDNSEGSESEAESDQDERTKRLSKTFGPRTAPTIRKEYTALSDNSKIEDDLGHLGLLCVEDLIDQIYRCGPHFDVVSKYVGPFAMSSLRKIEGVHAEKGFTKGNLRLKINEKIMQMA